MPLIRKYWPILLLTLGLLLAGATWLQALDAPILSPLLIACALVGAAYNDGKAR